MSPVPESWLPATLVTHGPTVTLRRAGRDDVAAIVGLLSADQLGGRHDGVDGPGGGALRAQIEAVRVADDLRGDGLGTAIFEWAIGVARDHGCALLQLTSDRSRVEAHRFYERLGFIASHQGYKLEL